MKRLILLLTTAATITLLALPFWFLQPNASPVAVAQAASPAPGAFPAAAAAEPARLLIPSIALNAPVINVGLTSNGDMAVPPGNTGEVGWYAAGTVPGQAGSAVMDAHVFAAFKNLHDLKVGSDLYVLTETGATLHFKVTEMDDYPLAEVPAQRLFNTADGKYLNLITCAGSFVPSQNTYDHRLVVYSVLVN